MFILVVGAVLLFIGFFLEALSMLLSMAPVLLPSLETMGVNPNSEGFKGVNDLVFEDDLIV